MFTQVPCTSFILTSTTLTSWDLQGFTVYALIVSLQIQLSYLHEGSGRAGVFYTPFASMFEILRCMTMYARPDFCELVPRLGLCLSDHHTTLQYVSRQFHLGFMLKSTIQAPAPSLTYERRNACTI